MDMEKFEGKVIEKFEKFETFIIITFTDKTKIVISADGNDITVEE